MCGIAGHWFNNALADQRLLEAQATSLAHRGPDGAGFWSDGSLGLAHRRLAIVDLSPTGVQPMVSASGRYVITFNGEVYNYVALRKELAESGKAPPWRGSSDTEVMLAAIEAWGLIPALSRFIGMFAFALWDTADRTLHLVRDRLGIKPLYYAVTSRGLCFGSEIKSLRPCPDFDTRVDADVLAAYIRANCVPGERSIYRGTRHVAPGTILRFAQPCTPPQVTVYWSAADVIRESQAHPFRGTEDEAADALDTLLRSAVSLRMVADVPLGAFLSGGIDSSTVVALMQAQSSRPVRTFSIESESEAFDEGDAARAVARHLNTHHTALPVTAREALEAIPLMPGIYDEPFADSSQIPTYLVSRLARRDVTVALSGDGGDELFGGYLRHIVGPKVWSFERRLPAAARTWAARAIRSRSPATWDRLFTRVGAQVRIPGVRMHKLAAILGVTSPREMYDVLSSHWLAGDSVLLAEAAPRPPEVEPPAGLSVAEFMMFRDLTGYLPDDILTKVDRASMAVSLEAREPLLDHRLLALAWSLPLRFKIRGTTGKRVLRRVLHRYVPEAIITRSKTGFGVPLGDWLRGPLRPWAEELLAPERLRRQGLFNPQVVHQRWREHLSGELPWEYHLWDILMFQAWVDTNRVAMS